MCSTCTPPVTLRHRCTHNFGICATLLLALFAAHPPQHNTQHIKHTQAHLHAVWVPVVSKANDNHPVLLAQNCLVDCIAAVQVRQQVAHAVAMLLLGVVLGVVLLVVRRLLLLLVRLRAGRRRRPDCCCRCRDDGVNEFPPP